MSKKHGARWLTLLVLLFGIATVLYSFFFVLQDDVTAPQITVFPKEIEISVTAGEEELLKGVTAQDNRDGDVTASLVVEKISSLMEGDKATITYAAFDKAGNVSRAVRILQYTDYEPTVIGQSEALVFTGNYTPDVLACMTAMDKVDGDISNRVKGVLVSDTTSLTYAGVHQVEFRVTNSMGQTEYLTLPVEVCEPGLYSAKVQLSEYLVRIKQGSLFRPESYLQTITIGRNEYPLDNQNPPIVYPTKDELKELPKDRDLEVRTYINNFVDPSQNPDPCIAIVNVEMTSNVKTGTPGVYSVCYTVTYQNRSVGYTRLNVVVEE